MTETGAQRFEAAWREACTNGENMTDAMGRLLDEQGAALEAAQVDADLIADERDRAELSMMEARCETALWVSAYDAEVVRLKRVEVLADEWESRTWHPGNPRDDCALLAARRLRAALAPEAEEATS